METFGWKVAFTHDDFNDENYLKCRFALSCSFWSHKLGVNAYLHLKKVLLKGNFTETRSGFHETSVKKAAD